MTWRILTGDCIEQMRTLPDCSVDAVVTDPPYGIGFMGHEWDQPEFPAERGNGTPAMGAREGAAAAALERQMARTSRRGTQPRAATGAGHARERDAAKMAEHGIRDHTQTCERGGAMHAGRYDLSPTANAKFQGWTAAWAREALRVLKPGGHLVCFASTRTYHRMASGVEDAGFEIRDQICWLFGSGFPKSRNLDGDWEGWGTALKPGHEPILLARRPLIGTVAQNVLEHGTGALHIDGCRIAHSEGAGRERVARPLFRRAEPGETVPELKAEGRWPANVVLDAEAASLLDEQTGELASGREGVDGHPRHTDKFRRVYGTFRGTEIEHGVLYGDAGGASRFFYCAKASPLEREAGLGHMPKNSAGMVSNTSGQHITRRDGGAPGPRANHHPTVKPVALMRWLVRMVTPPGGVVLDPFAGSGTTGIRPENRHRYPANWDEISLRIKAERARWRCECTGECGRGTHEGRCPNRHGDRAYGTGSRVVLTTAHLDHTPEHCDDGNLRAMCQGCHLHYDREHHAETRRMARSRALEAAGVMPLPFTLELMEAGNARS